MLNSEAFETFYEKNYDMVMHYAKRHGWAGMAEDITQEVFMTAWQKWDLVCRHENAKGWLMETAKKKICEHHRRNAREQCLLSEEDILRIGREDMEYALVEWKVTLKDNMNMEACRAFLEYYALGFSISWLACRENTNVAALRVKLSRVKNKLKVML